MKRTVELQDATQTLLHFWQFVRRLAEDILTWLLICDQMLTDPIHVCKKYKGFYTMQHYHNTMNKAPLLHRENCSAD